MGGRVALQCVVVMFVFTLKTPRGGAPIQHQTTTLGKAEQDLYSVFFDLLKSPPQMAMNLTKEHHFSFFFISARYGKSFHQQKKG